MNKHEREEETVEQKILQELQKEFENSPHTVIPDTLSTEQEIKEWFIKNPSSRNTLGIMIKKLQNLYRDFPELSSHQKITALDSVQQTAQLFWIQEERWEKQSKYTEQDIRAEIEINAITKLAKQGYYSGRWMQQDVFARVFKGVLWDIYCNPQTEYEKKIREEMSDLTVLFSKDANKVKDIIHYIEDTYHYRIMGTVASKRSTFKSMKEIEENAAEMDMISIMQALCDYRRKRYKIMQEPQRQEYLQWCCKVLGQDFLYDWQAHALCNADYFVITAKFDERKMHRKECTRCTYTSLEGKPTKIMPRQLNDYRKGLKQYPDKYEIIKPAKPYKENYRIKVL